MREMSADQVYAPRGRIPWKAHTPSERDLESAGRSRLHAMHMIFRTLWHLRFVASKGAPLGFADVGVSQFRVWPTDTDMLGHMNNGKYLSIMDVARFDLIKRNGTWDLFTRERWYPVVVAQTITYRRSLNPWKKFAIESRILGFDDQAVYLEQRFTRPAGARSAHPGSPEIYARAIVRARILRREGGVVKIDELIEKTGAVPEELQLPEDIQAWGQASRLPSTRDDATSVWK